MGGEGRTMRPMPSRFYRRRRGFTLIELLLVIAIIALLTFVVIMAINPKRQLMQTRNAQRQSNLEAILNAVYQYMIDYGKIPASIPTGEGNAKQICQFDATFAGCTAVGGIMLRELSGAYIAAMPTDPSVLQTGTGTRYKIYRDTGGRIKITAVASEDGKTITATR